jgi:hypothetical protein
VEQVAEEGSSAGDVAETRAMGFFGTIKQVDGSLRLDVMQHDAVLVLVLEFGGDFAVDDFLEDRLGHGESCPRNTRKTRKFLTNLFGVFVCSVGSEEQQLQIGTPDGAGRGEVADEVEGFLIFLFARGVARVVGGISAGGDL